MMIKHSYTTIGVRLTYIAGLALLLVVVGMFARGNVGTTFAMGALQLQVDSYATYNGVLQPTLTWALKDLVPGVDKFFDFNNVLPGDEGTTVISLHTNQNAWVCMDFTNLQDEDNGTNEPESPEDPDGQTAGELVDGMEFFGWFDDGDNVYETNEEIIFGDQDPQAAIDVLKEYIIADASTGSYFAANQTKYLGINWCAGDLTVNPATGAIGCDGKAMGNTAQSDSFSVDLGLRVVTADDYPGYRCDGSVPPPDDRKTVTLNLEKKFSGPVPTGYLPQQFTFKVVGNGVDQIVTLTPYTEDSANGTISLATGTYAITEIGPDGFVPADWRPGWYGECDSGSTFSTTITIDEDNIDHGTLYCQVDNQYRPQQKAKVTPPPPPVTNTVMGSSNTSGTNDRSNRTSESRRR